MNTQVPEAQRVKSKINSKKITLRHIMIKLLKVIDSRILKAASWENQFIPYQGTPKGYGQISQKKPIKPEGSGMIYSEYWKKKNKSQINTMLSKTFLQKWGRHKGFPKQKLRVHHKFSTRNAEGSSSSWNKRLLISNQKTCENIR